MGKIYYNGVDYSAPTSSGVAGVKGSAESEFRTGEVTITPENLGLDKVNNTADNEKKVKYAENANNAGYADCLNNVDGGHEVEIGYNIPVSDHTKIMFFAAFTSDSDEIIIRPVEDALVREYFSMVTTQEVIDGTITFGNSDDYGLRAYADNYGRIGDSSKQFYEVHAKSIYENKTLLSNKYAVKSHASTSSSTYGCGTANNWGHVKLSDSYTSSSGAASSGVAASSKALYDAYTTLNAKFNDIGWIKNFSYSNLITNSNFKQNSGVKTINSQTNMIRILFWYDGTSDPQLGYLNFYRNLPCKSIQTLHYYNGTYDAKVTVEVDWKNNTYNIYSVTLPNSYWHVGIQEWN